MKAFLVLLSLCFAGFGLAACTPEQAATSTVVADAVGKGVAPVLQPGELSGTLVALGVNPAKQAAINTAVAQAQSAALRACRLLPLAEGIANVAIATVASGLGPTAQTVSAGVNVLCRGLSAAPTYMSSRPGQLVKATVRVGNYDVPVWGYRK